MKSAFIQTVMAGEARSRISIATLANMIIKKNSNALREMTGTEAHLIWGVLIRVPTLYSYLETRKKCC